MARYSLFVLKMPSKSNPNQPTEASVVAVRREITMLEVTLPLSEVNTLQVALSVCCFVILYLYATGSNLLTVHAK